MSECFIIYDELNLIECILCVLNYSARVLIIYVLVLYVCDNHSISIHHIVGNMKWMLYSIYINTAHTKLRLRQRWWCVSTKKLFSTHPSLILFHNHWGKRIKFLWLSEGLLYTGHRDSLKIDAAIIFYSTAIFVSI